MAAAWVTLDRVAYATLDSNKRIQSYVDLLRLPLVVGRAREALLRVKWGRHLLVSRIVSDRDLVVGDARKMLLDGLDQITGEKFEGDLCRFVDWAIESERGKSLRLDLGGP